MGRVLFNEILPPELRFVNDALDKKKLKELVAAAYQTLGPEGTAEVVDHIKDIGFKYATASRADDCDRRHHGAAGKEAIWSAWKQGRRSRPAVSARA